MRPLGKGLVELVNNLNDATNEQTKTIILKQFQRSFALNKQIFNHLANYFKSIPNIDEKDLLSLIHMNFVGLEEGKSKATEE